MLLHLRFLLCADSSFNHVGGRPLHNVQSLIFRSLIEVLKIWFATSSSTVFPKILPDVLSFLRHSCSFKSRSLIPLLPSWRVHCRLSIFRPLGTPLTTLSVPSLTAMSLARMVRCDIPLRAAANTQLPRALFVSCRWHPTARCRSPYRSFTTLTLFTAASYLGAYICTAKDWSWSLTLQTSLRHFLVCHRLFSPYPHLCYDLKLVLDFSWLILTSFLFRLGWFLLQPQASHH
jgi:hypothetical protein